MKIALISYLFFISSSFPQSNGEAARPLPNLPQAAALEKIFTHDSTYNQKEEPDSLFDSGTYSLRKPSEKLLNEFKKDKELNYRESEDPSNLIEMISAWINGQIEALIQSRGFGIFQEYLPYFIAAAALAIVIIILKKNKLSGIIYGIKDSNYINFREMPEDISKIDLDSLISLSLDNKEFKIALRYHYLKSIKLLSDNKFINWEANKTNCQYKQEIPDPEIKKSFEELTLLFEWMWYGDYPVEESLFYITEKKFSNFYSRLKISI